MTGILHSRFWVSAATTYTTLNPSDKSANNTLSNGNLTVASATVLWAAVRGVAGKSTGKFYYEARQTAGTYCGIGIGTSSASLTADGADSSAAWLLRNLNASRWDTYGATAETTNYIAGPASPTQNMMIAVDVGAGKVWFGRGGTWVGDPGAGTSPAWSTVSGTIYPMIWVSNDGGSSVTCNFGTTSFSYSIPSGFTGWTA